MNFQRYLITNRTQKLLLLNNGLFTANVLSAMILSLTPCDFFLWGFVKGNVFATPPVSIEDTRDRIVNELANLREDPEMIKKGVQGYAEAR